MFKMDRVINLDIPEVGEQILDHIDTDGLFQLFRVSRTWKILAENVLVKRWRDGGKPFDACVEGKAKIVKLLLERCKSEKIGLNARDEFGCTPFMWACYNGHKDVV